MGLIKYDLPEATLRAYINRLATIAILQARQALGHQLLETLHFRVDIFGNEDFSKVARQEWLEQLIQSTVHSISLSES